MIIIREILYDKNGNVLGESFQEANQVTVLYAKKNKDGLLEADWLGMKFSQAMNVNLTGIQILHSELHNQHGEVLRGYKLGTVYTDMAKEQHKFVLLKNKGK